jgi:uncharacterized membrane protein YciS (DUF1049 family)
MTLLQIFSAIIFFYVFGLAAIIMTYLIVRAIVAYVRAARKEKQQKEQLP